MPTPSVDNQPDGIVDGFRASWRAKAALPPSPIATPRYRRVVGLVLGGVIAIVYGGVSQVINRLMLPDVPFTQPPLGLAGNLVLYVACGLAIGLACAWPERSTDGVMRGSLVAVLTIIAQGLIANPLRPGESPLTFTTILGFGLLFITAIPAMMLLRLAVDNQTEALDKPAWAWERSRVPLALAGLIVIAGAFSIFPDHVQKAFVDLHTLIETGLNAGSSADLPTALRDANGVKGFLNFATADYALEQNSDFDLVSDLSLDNERGNTVLVALFKRGAILACAYNPHGERLRCKSYLTAEFFKRTG